MHYLYFRIFFALSYKKYDNNVHFNQSFILLATAGSEPAKPPTGSTSFWLSLDKSSGQHTPMNLWHRREYTFWNQNQGAPLIEITKKKVVTIMKNRHSLLLDDAHVLHHAGRILLESFIPAAGQVFAVAGFAARRHAALVRFAWLGNTRDAPLCLHCTIDSCAEVCAREPSTRWWKNRCFGDEGLLLDRIFNSGALRFFFHFKLSIGLICNFMKNDFAKCYSLLSSRVSLRTIWALAKSNLFTAAVKFKLNNVMKVENPEQENRETRASKFSK